jgi:hypothetical protein
VFIQSIVGASWKNEEIGGLAPTASPPVNCGAADVRAVDVQRLEVAVEVGNVEQVQLDGAGRGLALADLLPANDPGTFGLTDERSREASARASTTSTYARRTVRSAQSSFGQLAD